MITTTQVTEQLSPALLRSEIDERIVKVRPTSTPLDQISRLAGARHSASMKVDYYSIDIKRGSSTVKNLVSSNVYFEGDTIEVTIDDANLLSESDTVFFPEIIIKDNEQLICYVVNVDGNKVKLLPVNADVENGTEIGPFGKGTMLIRMGRAAGELDVQTPQYSALPVKSSNYCQIFKAQIEESMLQRLSDKEVGWTFSDQEEVAVLDMRMCMERSFLFGRGKKISLSPDREIFLTGGIWNQTDKEFHYDKPLDKDSIISMMRQAFSDSNGSMRKVLLAGSGLIEQLNRQDGNVYVPGDRRISKWGLDFEHIVSKFGSLYVARCEVFDLCGMEDYGMVIDPEYISKYSHIPFSAERISFHKQGVRNTEAVVLTEASCLVLRYPNAHMKIIPNKAKA